MAMVVLFGVKVKALGTSVPEAMLRHNRKE